MLRDLYSNLRDLDPPCKEYYLLADKNMASISIFAAILLLPPMAYLDYINYKFSANFYISVWGEFMFALFSLGIVFLIWRNVHLAIYEKLVFIWALTAAIFAFCASMLQPERIVENLLFSVIFFIANFTSLPNRWLFRFIPAVLIYITLGLALSTNRAWLDTDTRYMFTLIFCVLTAVGIFTIASNNHFKRTAYALQQQEHEERLAYEALAAEKSRLTELLQQELVERKHAEDEVRQFNAKLEQRVSERTSELETAIKELESFSYTVGHDLRAPLRSINGFSNLLLEDYGETLPTHVQKELGRIENSAKTMGEMMDALLEFSRLTRVLLRRVEFDLSDLVRGLLMAVDRPDIDFRVETGLMVSADWELSRKLVRQLLDNAIKSTARTPQPCIEFGRLAQDEQEVYFVRDNGLGFDMAYSKSLFQPFQKLHRVDEFPGRGVGLVIAQRIIQRHGGCIWAEAEPNKGATFFFTMQ